MKNERLVQVHVVFELTSNGLKLDRMTVSKPDGGAGTLTGEKNWSLLAAVMLVYRIRMYASPSYGDVILTPEDTGFPQDTFKSAWVLIKNHLNKPMPRGDAGRGMYHRWINGIDNHGELNLSISINPKLLPWGNITFAMVPSAGAPQIDLCHPAEWQVALDALLGRNVEGVKNIVRVHRPAAIRHEPFCFGNYATKTFIAETFPDGVALDHVECHHVNDDFQMPPELMPLVVEACRIISDSLPAGKNVINAPQFAPVKIERVRNYDDDNFERVKIWLADSHYNFYTAAAYAEVLARVNSKFEPLRQFVDAMTDPRIPSPASCSMGTRVMLETADERLVICYRSRDCKMNPDMWSTSANEGVRPILLKTGLPFNKLLEEAAKQALINELRVEWPAISSLLLLSLHQNAYAQWGATLYAKTTLLLEDVLRRQRTAAHRNEHDRVASLPVDLEECGREMIHRGSRWYGGALESICTTLAWRELGRGNHLTAEEVGRILSTAAGGKIMPCDEVNMDYLRRIA